MRPKEEQMKFIPVELRDIAYCSYHSKLDTWYVYRRDGSVYDPIKKRSHDKRTPLGQIKNGMWRYSPTWLRIRELEKLNGEAGKNEPKQPSEPQA